MTQCCDREDPSSALENLIGRVKDGQLGEGVLFKLLQTVQRKAGSSFPPSLIPLLNVVEENTHEPNSDETKGEKVCPHVEFVSCLGDTGLNQLALVIFYSIIESDQQNDSISEANQMEEEVEASTQEDTENEDKDINSASDSSSPPTSSSPSSSKPFSCRWCKKDFAYKCRMLVHMKRCSMSQECKTQCPQCPKKLANSRALLRHQAEAHRNTSRVKKKVACDLCGRTFAHPSGENDLQPKE